MCKHFRGETKLPAARCRAAQNSITTTFQKQRRTPSYGQCSNSMRAGACGPCIHGRPPQSSSLPTCSCCTQLLSGITDNVARRIEPTPHQHEPAEADQEPLRERNVDQTFKHRYASLQSAVGRGADTPQHERHNNDTAVMVVDPCTNSLRCVPY